MADPQVFLTGQIKIASDRVILINSVEDTTRLFFNSFFKALSKDHPAYPWQEALFLKMVSDDPWPDTVSTPTGSGKTAIIKIWLIALAWSLIQNKPSAIPTGLFWVVNCRVVVDQTSDEADEIQDWLKAHQDLANPWPKRYSSTPLPNPQPSQ